VNPSVEGDRSVDGGTVFELLRVCDVLHSIGENIRMRVSPDERSELHDTDEPRQISYLRL